MSEEPWKDARDALNRFGKEEVEPERAAATRRKAIASMERGAARSWRGVIVGFALLMGGGLAFAQLGSELAAWIGIKTESVSDSVSASVSDSVSVSDSDSDSVSVSSSDSVSASDPASDSNPVSHSVSGSNSTPYPKSRITTETSLYRRAHTLQFSPTANTPAIASSALAAWDSYLHSYPHGLFAPEAHYNRAIALIRLDRLDAAAKALEPFACQAAGGYRTTEARSLIARIHHRAPQIVIAPCALTPEPKP